MTQENPTPTNPWDQFKEPEAQKKKKKRFILLGVMALLIVVAYLIARYQGFRWHLNFKTNARHLSDGFFVIGLFITGIGALLWVSTTGFFDIINYAFKSMLVMFTPFVKPGNFPKFYEYKVAKAEKRQKAEFSPLFMGLGLIAISVIMLFLHYNL